MKLDELLLEGAGDQPKLNWGKLLDLIKDWVIDWIKKHNANIPITLGPDGRKLKLHDLLKDTDEVHPSFSDHDVNRAWERVSEHGPGPFYDAIENCVGELGGNVYDHYVNLTADAARRLRVPYDEISEHTVKIKYPKHYDIKETEIKQMIWKLSPDIHHFLRRMEEEIKVETKKKAKEYDAKLKTEADGVSAEEHKRFVDFIRNNFDNEMTDFIKWVNVQREKGRLGDPKWIRFLAWMPKSAIEKLSKPADFAPYFKKVAAKKLKDELRNAFVESARFQKDEKLLEFMLNRHLWNAAWPEIESFLKGWIEKNGG